jgi:hypothetical protein
MHELVLGGLREDAVSRLDRRLRRLLDAAEAHGEAGDPEMEIGDLQGVLMSAWAKLTPTQRAEVAAEHAALVDDWGAR